MIAKCGQVRIWHWAHKGRRSCDPWWEPETEWHRAWKNQFPVNWQEIVHRAETGEKHISDVKTDRGWVIEFQRSHITPEERRARDTFYRKVIWVVDGTRLKKDAEQFAKALSQGAPVRRTLWVRLRSNECALVRKWADSCAPIFFDFGGDLFWLHVGRPDGPIHVARLSRESFIGSHRSGGTQQEAHDFDELVKELPGQFAQHEAQLRAQATQPLLGFQQYLARQYRARRRL
jgi:hypothetical protein